MGKPNPADGYDEQVTESCERVLVTRLRGLGPYKESVCLVGGLTPRCLHRESGPRGAVCGSLAGRSSGNGMSDWDIYELSLDAWLSDLETVVNAGGVERFPLLGISQGSAISIPYAVRYRERVSHLVLYG